MSVEVQLSSVLQHNLVWNKQNTLLLDEQESMTADFQSDFDEFRRTVLRFAGKKSFSYEEAADFCTEQYQKNGDLLLVVNTKQAALTIFQKLKERNSEFATVLHLSTNMCPATGEQ